MVERSILSFVKHPQKAYHSADHRVVEMGYTTLIRFVANHPLTMESCVENLCIIGSSLCNHQQAFLLIPSFIQLFDHLQSL